MRPLQYNSTETRWADEGTIVDAEMDDIVVATVADVAITLASGDYRMEPDHTAGMLFAAAPSLLAALEYIVGWNPDDWSAEKARDLARKAIAQAKGEAPCPFGEKDCTDSSHATLATI